MKNRRKQFCLQTVTYSYWPNSSLVSNIVFASGGQMKMTTTKTYDALQRLTDIRTLNAQLSTLNAHRYDYNAANQRTRRTDADGSYWDYTYDALGQVTAGWKKWSDGTPVAGQQYGYDYDDIGNRTQSGIGVPPVQSVYSANALNQYTERTVPGAVDILGTAHSNATVTVNNQPVTRQGEYFHKQLPVSNASSAVYTQLTTVAVLKNAGSNQMDIVSSVTGKVFVAKSPELFGYDADGNLTNDGRFAYTWDGENRLLGAETLSGLPSSVPRQKLLFGYDSQSRRVSKVVSNWTGSAWVCTNDLRFVYDGWNLLAEVGTTGSVGNYTWGLDLSGTEQGAGGIGGLLYGTLGGSSSTSTVAYAFDGNGNVAGLLNLETGNLGTEYEYSPFGETIRATGPLAKANPFRFSTKYQYDETGLLYYGYRYYQPSTGRWVNRDPIGEEGGENVYAAFFNCPTRFADHFGKNNSEEWGANSSSVFASPPVTVSRFGGFYVVGSTMEVRCGRVWQFLGFDHVDIAYNGTVVYVGRGGGADRGGREVRSSHDIYPLSVRSAGKMRYGQRAPCPCKGSTDADILDCLRNRRPVAGRNCQGDVLDAIGDCCLSGWSSLVGRFCPNWYGR